MKTRVLFTMLAMLMYASVFAQPVVKNQWIAGGSSDDIFTCMDLTKDGGYILGGYSNSDISGNKTENSIGANDYWVVKLDNIGAIQWDKTIQASKDDKLYAIQQTADGGYILGGNSFSPKSGDKTQNSKGAFDYWVVKLSANGNIQWDKTIGGSDGDLLTCMQQTSDRGYIVGGYSFSNKSGDKTENSRGSVDYWIVKLNGSGNIQWDKTIGGNNYDDLTCLQQTSDGGYILGGWSVSGASGEKTENSKGFQDFWVVKLNASGSIQWDKTIGGFNLDELYSLQQTTDGGYILGGTSQSFSGGNVGDYWIVKTDASGSIQWNKSIGGSDNDYLRSIRQTSDGGYISGGYSYSKVSGDKTQRNRGLADYWMVRTDGSGNVQWDRTVGGADFDYMYSVREVKKNLYVAGGYSNSKATGDKKLSSKGGYDYWLVQVKYNEPATIANSFLASLQNHDLKSGNKDFIVYPNPAKNMLYVQANGTGTLTLTSQSGKILYTKTINGKGEINITNLSAGLYFLKNNATGTVQKVVVSR